MQKHSLTRRWFFSRVILATAGSAAAPVAIKAAPPPLTLDAARAAYPVTVDEASRIMVEHYRKDGPLLAADAGRA